MKFYKVKTLPRRIMDFMGIDKVTFVMFAIMEFTILGWIVLLIVDRA